MYLKLIRHNRPFGQLQRGTVYTVHFQPNEKGGYNETLTAISDVYEIATAAEFPPALIYTPGIRCVNGHMRLALGRGSRKSLLHLIDRAARDRFFPELIEALRNHEDVRIEVAIAFGK